MQPLPYLFMVPILLWAAWTDMRHRRVSNAAVFAAAMIFVLSIPLIGWGEAGLRLGMAVAVFACGLPLFVLHVVRGGDVKLAAALMLFVPPGTHALFAFHFLLTVSLSLMVLKGLRMRSMDGTSALHLGRAGNNFPISSAITSAGVLHIATLSFI